MKFSENRQVKLYRCNVCGNLLVMLNDSGMNPICCARDMELLVPGSEEASEEYHIPMWKMEGCKVIVCVGKEPHPQTKEHHIEWIILETNKGIYQRRITEDDLPETCFKLCKDEEVVSVYAYCNLHKLWKSTKEAKQFDCPLCGV